MTERAIYPDSFASMLIERAGQKYQPSNGTEGECFFDAWCCQCARDKHMSEGKNRDDCADSEVCRIIADTMAYSPEDEEYPKEWQYDRNGQPCCTAFVPAGQRIPDPRDERTIDMFAENAAVIAPEVSGGDHG